MPPSVSLYDTPVPSSLSTTAEASEGERLVNSGAYCGWATHRKTSTAASSSAPVPSRAMTFCAGVNAAKPRVKRWREDWRVSRIRPASA